MSGRRDYELRHVKRDGTYVWELRCPECGKWGDLDDDQLRGRVSIQHPAPCGFHETIDFSRHPLVAQVDEFAYLKGSLPGRARVVSPAPSEPA